MNRLQRRFDELEALAGEIAASLATEPTTRPSRVQYFDQPTQYEPATSYRIDFQKFTQWYSSVQSLLSHIFGKEQPHYVNFETGYKSAGSNLHDRFKYMHSIFRAAKDDYEGGYLWDIQALAHAKVFASELEQATELLGQGYKTPAAVVAGIVLETALRERCDQNKIPHGNMNRMNDDLAKLGLYNDARKTQIQAWAKLRNNAAHGKPNEFTESEVSQMITGIGDFLAAMTT